MKLILGSLNYWLTSWWKMFIYSVMKHHCVLPVDVQQFCCGIVHWQNKAKILNENFMFKMCLRPAVLTSCLLNCCVKSILYLQICWYYKNTILYDVNIRQKLIHFLSVTYCTQLTSLEQHLGYYHTGYISHTPFLNKILVKQIYAF